jgi:murein DD-endopeptidase MepM/ murein hydrolase activator NlpD
MEPTEKPNKKLSAKVLRQFPKSHAVAAGSLVASLCLLLALLPSEDAAATRDFQQVIELSLPGLKEDADTEFRPQPDPSDDTSIVYTEDDPADAEATALESAAAELSRKEFTIRSGDSLSILFRRAGLSDGDLYELLNQCPEAKGLRRIMPGHNISFQIDEAGKLQQLSYTRSRLESLNFIREKQGFVSVEAVREPEVHLAYRQATINSSLFLAGQSAGMTDSLIMELANIFGWDVDFALDIRQGDSFSVLFEEQFVDGEKIGNGAILAAEFTNQGKTFTAVRYTNANGINHYYTPEGNSMRREFLRTPVDFARISSHFNLKRRHPILHSIRAHKGTDYAAATGTPIRAAGDGRVSLAGRKGGYGNTVIIQHGQTYQTLYAHMHNFHRNIRAGARVRQGQIIGYVGSTGLATGPHLHYEFYVNGVVRNPVTVNLPQASSIAASEKERFMSKTQPIIARLERYHQATRLAMSNDDIKVN